MPKSMQDYFPQPTRAQRLPKEPTLTKPVSKEAAQSSSIVNILPEQFRPNDDYVFPKKRIGKKQRSLKRNGEHGAEEDWK